MTNLQDRYARIRRRRNRGSIAARCDARRFVAFRLEADADEGRLRIQTDCDERSSRAAKLRTVDGYDQAQAYRLQLGAPVRKYSDLRGVQALKPNKVSQFTASFVLGVGLVLPSLTASAFAQANQNAGQANANRSTTGNANAGGTTTGAGASAVNANGNTVTTTGNTNTGSAATRDTNANLNRPVSAAPARTEREDDVDFPWGALGLLGLAGLLKRPKRVVETVHHRETEVRTEPRTGPDTRQGPRS